MRPVVRRGHIPKALPRAQPVVKILCEHRQTVAIRIVPAGIAEIVGIAVEHPAHARSAQPRLRDLDAGRRRRDMGRGKRRAAAHGCAAARRRNDDARARRTQIHRCAGRGIAAVKLAAAIHARDRDHRLLIGRVDIVGIAGGVALAAVARRRDHDRTGGIRLRKDAI